MHAPMCCVCLTFPPRCLLSPPALVPQLLCPVPWYPSYRLYPVRNGESIEDIISKRKISMNEMQSLNPGVDLNKLGGG